MKTTLQEEAQKLNLSLTEYLIRCGLKTGLPQPFERPIETRQLGTRLLTAIGRLQSACWEKGSDELNATLRPLIDDLLEGAEGLTQ